jgi:hypothetical protein
MLFATHPVHTEAITWVAGMPELSFTFFSLLSFYSYIPSGKAIPDGVIFFQYYHFSLPLSARDGPHSTNHPYSL